MVDSFTLAKKKLYTLLHTKDYMSDTPRTDAHYKQILDDALGLEYCETELRYWSEKLECELSEAVEKERERCALVCEGRAGHNSMGAYQILMAAAAEIRKGE
jgi:Ni,Fe-hydrogenase I small subunit